MCKMGGTKSNNVLHAPPPPILLCVVPFERSFSSISYKNVMKL
jgi:hypothetical protein